MGSSNDINTILYATDLGDHMRPVFRTAIRFARNFDAKIIMLHVIEPIGATGEAVLSLYLPQKNLDEIEHENIEHIIENMQQRLQRFCEHEQQSCDDSHTPVSDIIVKTGRASEVISRQAIKLNADMIVVGSHNRRGSDPGLLGSTSRAVTHDSPVPVLVVPNRGT